MINFNIENRLTEIYKYLKLDAIEYVKKHGEYKDGTFTIAIPKENSQIYCYIYDDEFREVTEHIVEGLVVKDNILFVIPATSQSLYQIDGGYVLGRPTLDSINLNISESIDETDNEMA